MNRLTHWLRGRSQCVTMIGCANGLAGRHLGCEEAPTAIKNSAILHKSRFPHVWENIITESPEANARQLSALPHVRVYSTELARCTRRVVEQGRDLCVVGGDHSCAIGTWSGVASGLTGRGRLGLIWLDAHMDAHTPQSSESGNLHGMPVAHLLGYGDLPLAGIFDKIPKVHPENLCLIGIRSFEAGEEKLLRDLNVRVFFMDEVKKRGCHAVLQEALGIVQDGTAGFGMSIDLDGFDAEFAPAVGTPEADGVDAFDFLSAVAAADLRKLVATEIAEFLPARDVDGRSERLVVDLVRTIYSAKWKRSF